MEAPFDAQTEYRDQAFKKLKYSGKTIRNKTFDTCTFTGCTFTETIFERCKFRDCTFRECDLRLVRVDGSAFMNTRFEQSKVTGINWTTSAWAKGGLFTPVHFVDCDISLSVFFGLELKKIEIVRCTARGADFAEADLTGASCASTDFAEARFLHTNLTKADFTNATNYSIAASQNTLKKAKFSLPEAIRLLYDLGVVLVEQQ